MRNYYVVLTSGPHTITTMCAAQSFANACDIAFSKYTKTNPACVCRLIVSDAGNWVALPYPQKLEKWQISNHLRSAKTIFANQGGK